jgi:adenine-specific DNA-methyltransferase
MLKVAANGKLACISGCGNCYRPAGPMNADKLTGRASVVLVKTSDGSPGLRSSWLQNPKGNGVIAIGSRGLEDTISSARWVRLLNELESRRRQVSGRLDPVSKAELGQFLTPAPVAQFMTGMFAPQGRDISILDAGAGVGSLTAALIARFVGGPRTATRIRATLYEIDSALAQALERTMADCAELCATCGVMFEYEVLREDFLGAAAAALTLPLAGTSRTDFDCVILNPPYRKINGESETRRILTAAGIEANNLYSAFLAMAARLLKQGGELVAITPRSFCNGPYFKAFRRDFFSRMTLDRLHVYESRSHAFRDDEVLQENLIFHAVRTQKRPDAVVISSSLGPLDPSPRMWRVSYADVIHPRDPEMVVHVIADEAGRKAADVADQLSCSLHDLGLSVSTGRVVDFRARPYLRVNPDARSVPLIYPFNLENGYVVWPKPHPKKSTAIKSESATADLLIPSEVYIVVKRFSAKEERRRIVAALYDPDLIRCPAVGFENHLNYYHAEGRGLPRPLARGLTAFLNSTLADTYFRNLSGHTQVNAQDLRRLKYPSREQLLLIADRVGDDLADQIIVDRAVEEALELACSI